MFMDNKTILLGLILISLVLVSGCVKVFVDKPVTPPQQPANNTGLFGQLGSAQPSGSDELPPALPTGKVVGKK